MVFGFVRRRPARDVLLGAPLEAEPRYTDEIGHSPFEHLIEMRFTTKGDRRKPKKRPLLVDRPRSILLKMLVSDFSALLALRRTSKTMKSYVESNVRQQLQKKFETLEICFPRQIRQGPSILTFGEGLSWIGEFVKTLKVTVIPRHTEPNNFQTARDIEMTRLYWDKIAKKEFFHGNRSAGDFGACFETILRSLPFVEHIEIILTPLPVTMSDHKGLQIERSGYSSETWHWCPLFNEWPSPPNEAGTAAVTHLLPLILIRLALDAWCPVKLNEITLTNLTFTGLLALSHDALWRMGVTKNGGPLDPLSLVQPFWVSIKAVNINMVVFWEVKDMASKNRVKVGSKAYKLGMTILAGWINRMYTRRLTWTKLQLTAAKDEMDRDRQHLIDFVPGKGPGLFRFFWSLRHDSEVPGTLHD